MNHNTNFSNSNDRSALGSIGCNRRSCLVRADARKKLSKKRGVGAIIGGTILAVIIFTSIFVYFMTVLQTQTEKGKTDILASTADEEKKAELFKVSMASCGSSPCTTTFPIIVNNTGPNPLNATYAEVFPVDDPTDRAITPLTLIVSSDPTQQVLNAGESAIYSVPATDDGSPINASRSYHVDIVSSRGNIVSAILTPEDTGGSSTGSSGPQDFTIAAFPNSLVVNPGNSGTSTITLTSLNGFSDDISLSASGLPSFTTPSFSPTSPISLPSGGTVSSDLTLTTSPGTPTGTYTVTVTGTNGTLTHSTQISLTVFRSGGAPDFALAANPNSVVVYPGNSGSSVLLLTSLNSFAGTVSFDPVAGTPSGSTATILPTSVNVPNGGTASSNLQITTSSSTPVGTYPLDITAHSGSITHTTQVTLTILSPTPDVGERNTGTNIGSGQAQVYAGMSGTVLQFKSFAQGNRIILTNGTNTITIATTAENNTGNNLGTSASSKGLYVNKTGERLNFLSLLAGQGISISADSSGNLVISCSVANCGASSSTGEANRGQNATATGQAIYKGMNGVNLVFRTVQGQDGIVTSYSSDGNTVLIASDANSDLILKAQIQAIFPNPFGVSAGAQQPLWGAVIANPTDHPMNIRKLVISAIDPSLSSQRILCNANVLGVSPVAGSWSCAGQGSTWNVLEWTANGAALNIPAQSSQLFLARTGSPVTGANNDRPSIALNYNVYTDFGQFTKVGYDFGLRGAGTHPMVNVFLTSVSGNKNPSNVVGTVSVQGGNTVTVRASIANYVPSTVVDANAALIIDIPRAFTGVSVTSSAGFNSPCTPQVFADGSTQIRCTLPAGALNTAGLTDTDNVKTIVFSMTAPSVSTTKEYNLYVLGDGTTDAASFTLGPVSENVIRVTP